MALSFPNSPGIGNVYTDSTSGFSYEWDGTVWKSFAAASSANIKIIDDISSSFNGSTQTFSLTSSGNAITPPTAQSLIVNLGGVVQDPSDDYSVSGSQITFSTAPTAGLTFSATSLGPAVPVSIIPADTTTQGDFNVAGILSATSMKVAGVTTATADGVNITGILTARTVIAGSNVTLNSTGINVVGVGSITTSFNVGTALTSASAVVGSAVTINRTGVNVTGVITASGGIQGIGIYSGSNLVTSGIITALNFVGTGNTFLVSGNRVDISIAGGGGGGTSYNELDGMLFG